MERPADIAKVHDAKTSLGTVADKLVIIDEIQRKPELSSILRVLIDQQRRPRRFLLLGSALPDLRRQAAPSLAGLSIIWNRPLNKAGARALSEHS
jgi:predicted AAA+ superfamily ATPase